MGDVIWIDSQEQFYEEVDTFDTVVVLFTAPAWCRPCQQFEPHYKRAAAESHLKFLAVDIDRNDWAVVDFDVQSVPTCVIFKGGVAQAHEVKVPQGAIPFLKELDAIVGLPS